MKQVILDGAAIETPGQLHDVLTEALGLPEWYGRNLDALHDCLTIMKDVELVLRHWPADGYLARARRVMVDSAAENDRIKVTVE